MHSRTGQPLALDVASGKRSAYLSSLLTFITTILLILIATAYIRRTSDAGCDFDSFKRLNVTCLREFWRNNDKLQPLTFSFQIVSAIAAFLLVPAIMVLNEIFRRNGRPSQVMLPAVAAACGVRILEFTFNAGASMHSNWMARSWHLTDQDLKSLTISYLTVRSQGMWLFAMDYLFLAFAQMSAAFLTYKCANTMPRWWGHLGVFSGIIGGINFLVELGRLGSWFRMSEIAFLLQALDGFILLPIWTLVLGCKLYSASSANAQQLMDDRRDGGGLGDAQTLEMADASAMPGNRT